MLSMKKFEDIGISNSSKVLAFFPHPDDETGFAAGFLQKCVACGASVTVICVTKGDRGKSILKTISGDVLAQMRVTEFENAMKVLGINNYMTADFHDGCLEDEYKLVLDYIRIQLKVVKPDYVLTLEPCGIYGHPDHIALSKAVTKIVQEDNGVGNDAKSRLIYATIKPNKAFMFNRIRKEMAKEPDKIIPIEPNVEIKLSPVEAVRKIEAFRCHKSQFKPTMLFFMKWFYRDLLIYEYIHLV